MKELDYQGLLSDDLKIAEPSTEYETDDELLAALGVETPKEREAAGKDPKGSFLNVV